MQRNGGKNIKSVKKCFGVLLLVAGLLVFLAPDLYAVYFNLSNQRMIYDFQTKHGLTTIPDTTSPDIKQPISAETSPAYDELYAQIQAYNQQIYDEKQSEITDTWTFTQNPCDIELENNLFGYIEIPAMSVSLPLYIGATDENMAKGAVVLGETSLPVGGENTNSVIAGHRGYRGAPYFREIEKLAVGDEVHVANPWETLTYTVTGIAVIEPDNLEAILIQDGKDMVTLVTCHPYRSGGQYRYVVYCERSFAIKTKAEAPDEVTEQPQIPVSGEIAFVSSEPDIQRETLLRVGSAVAILILLVIALRPVKHKEQSQKINRPKNISMWIAVGIILAVCLLLFAFCGWSINDSLDESAKAIQANMEVSNTY